MGRRREIDMYFVNLGEADLSKANPQSYFFWLTIGDLRLEIYEGWFMMFYMEIEKRLIEDCPLIAEDWELKTEN